MMSTMMMTTTTTLIDHARATNVANKGSYHTGIVPVRVVPEQSGEVGGAVRSEQGAKRMHLGCSWGPWWRALLASMQ